MRAPTAKAARCIGARADTRAVTGARIVVVEAPAPAHAITEDKRAHRSALRLPSVAIHVEDCKRCSNDGYLPGHSNDHFAQGSTTGERLECVIEPLEFENPAHRRP